MTRKVVLSTGKWTSDAVVISPGLPQGSPLFPMLIAVYAAEMISRGDEQTGDELREDVIFC